MHLSRFRTMAICARTFMSMRLCGSGFSRNFAIQPVNFRHLANDDEFVAIGADRAVIVEAVALLGVTADHVRRFQHLSLIHIYNRVSR